MLYLIAKAVLSGITIVAAAKLAELSPLYRAFIVLLLIASCLHSHPRLALAEDNLHSEKVASLSEGAFWLALDGLS